MKYTNRFAALTLAATMGAGFVTMPFAAHASEEGKRNTAIGLGVAAAALLLTQRNKAPGAIVAAGAVIAATQIDTHDHDRYRRERDYGYDNRYYDSRRYNVGYGYNDNRHYNDDYRYSHEQYSRDRGRNYNDGQSGYRVGENGRDNGNRAVRTAR